MIDTCHYVNVISRIGWFPPHFWWWIHLWLSKHVYIYIYKTFPGQSVITCLYFFSSSCIWTFPGEIERAVYSGILEPSADWHSLTHEGSGANSDLRLTYRVRVQCEPHYYSATCTKLCRPRDDLFGHWECDRNGDKTCMPGWTGTSCDTGRVIFQFLQFFVYSVKGLHFCFVFFARHQMRESWTTTKEPIQALPLNIFSRKTRKPKNNWNSQKVDWLVFYVNWNFGSRM